MVGFRLTLSDPTLLAPNTPGQPFTLIITSTLGSTDGLPTPPIRDYRGPSARSLSLSVSGVANPPAPTGLTATPSTCGTGEISISWNGLVPPSQNYTLIDTVNGISNIINQVGPGISYTHTGLLTGSTHNYTLYSTATGPPYAGDSPTVATAPLVTLAPAACFVPPPPIPANLNAIPGACGTGTIAVYWDGIASQTYTLRDGATVIYTGTSSAFSHTGLAAGSLHNYFLTSTSTVPGNPYSGTSGIATPITPPANNIAPPVCPPLAPAGPCDLGCAGSIQYRLNASSPVSTFACPAGTKTLTNGGSWSVGACTGVFTRDPLGGTFSCILDAANCPIAPVC